MTRQPDALDQQTADRSAGSGPADSEADLFWIAAQDGQLRQVHPAFATLLGMPRSDVEGRSLLELAHPDDVATITESMAALTGGATEVLVDSRFREREGQWIPLTWVARPIPGGELWGAAGHDAAQVGRPRADRAAPGPYSEPGTGPAAAMWDLDVVTGALRWESQAAVIFGGADHDLPATVEQLAALAHPPDGRSVQEAFGRLGDLGAFETSVRLGLGTNVRQASIRGRVVGRSRRGRPRRAVGILVDVSTEKALEDQMLRLAMHDALTGAPNRRAFDQTLRGECRRSSRSLEPLSVLMIDIDDFRQFNDSHGHLVGDDALCALARALAGAVHREGDLLARFGGEEFAMVLPGADTVGALAVARRLVNSARSVAVRQAPGRRLTVSVGTATWLPDGTPLKPAGLLARADQALVAAKAEGKNRATAYEHSIAARDTLKAAIASGLDGGEFELYYQPVLGVAADAIVGFEALMRWNRPGHGLVPPDEFIPVAETSSLICDLGQWALAEATAQLATWSREGLDARGELRMAVNASARHVNTPAILDDVKAALSASGIRPGQLELELTETALTDQSLAAKHLTRVRELGVTVAIDDFGTGYTSIGQLPHLPVDTLKIDRSFVSSAEPRQQALVTLMIGAARAFDLAVVAEGVEDAATLDYLRSLGCDLVQGYLIARPMPAHLVPDWLAAWRAGNRDRRTQGRRSVAAT